MPTTQNRREWIPKAIDCFLRQTYERCELLILEDPMDRRPSIEHLVPASVRIRVVPPGDRLLYVGEKRNLLCREARGEIIAHWDDDDYSAPGRLEYQVKRLSGSGKPVHAFCEMKFTDGENWWLYRGTGVATSLIYLKSYWTANHFPDLNMGQDEHFERVAAARKQITLDPDRDLMYATVHEGNTSPRPVAGWPKLPGFEWIDGSCAA